MKNKGLFKQNLAIIIAIVPAWCLFFFSSTNIFGYIDFLSYSTFWLIASIYLIFFLPFLYIQHKRVVEKSNIDKLNKVFRMVNKIFIIVFLLLVILNLYDIFYYYISFNSFFSDLYYYFKSFDSSNLKDWLNWFLGSWPYLVIVILFWQANKFNKRLV
jgi:hypothetical protein